MTAPASWRSGPHDRDHARGELPPAARPEGERLRHGLVRTFKDGMSEVRTQRILLLILAVAALHGASTEGFDRLADLHFLSTSGCRRSGAQPVVWFGCSTASG